MGTTRPLRALWIRPLMLALAVLGLISLISAPVLADGLESLREKPQKYRDDGGQNTTFVRGQLVVKLMDTTAYSIDNVNQKFGTSVEKHLQQTDVYLLNAATDGEDLQELAVRVAAEPFVMFASPNYLVDPLKAVQGSYPFSDYSGSGSYQGQPAVLELNLPNAHQVATGNGITVGVIDGGVDYTHPAFGSSVISGWDYVDNDPDAFDEPGGDNSGHGTFVAGVVHLTAPDAQILAYRVSNVDGESHGYVVAEAILQAVDDGCDVINISMVTMGYHDAIHQAIKYARQHEVLVVVAAGNGNEDVATYPASDIYTVAVTAVDSTNRLAENARFGDFVTVSAPGSNIYSAYQDDIYAWWDGTSFAAPFVTGQAALLMETRGTTYTWSGIRNAIIGSAIDIDNLNPDYTGKLGRGLIDPPSSLTYNAVETADFIPDTLSLSSSFGGPEVYASAWLTSSNEPSPAMIEIVGMGPYSFVKTFDSLVSTPDSVLFAAHPFGLQSGTYYELVRAYVDGVDDPAELVIEFTVAEAPAGDSAFLAWDDLQFTIEPGFTDTLFNCNLLTSTNPPAAWSARVLDSMPFIQLTQTAGVTNDSICFTAYGGDLPEGRHRNIVEVTVGMTENSPLYFGVEFYVRDTIPGPEQLEVFPDTVFAAANANNPVSLTSCVYVSSGNTNETYFIEPIGSPVFVNFADSFAVTNDTLCFDITLGPSAAGTLYNDVVLYAPNINMFDTFTVALTLVEAGADTAWISPDSFSFFAAAGTEEILYDWAVLNSSNAPAPDSFIVLGTPQFVLPYRRFRETPDSISIRVYPAWAGDAGTYTNTVRFFVQGVLDPVDLPVTLTIDSGFFDSAWVAPDTVAFSAALGSTTSQTQNVGLYATDSPRNWTGFVVDSVFSSAISLGKTSGQTNDTIAVTFDPSGLPAGISYQEVQFNVDGITNPVSLVVKYSVLSGDEEPTLTLNPLYFSAPEGNDTVLLRCTELKSPNSPAAYTGTLIDDGDNFVVGFDTTGFTNDIVCVSVSTAGRSAGNYLDTIVYSVDGLSQTAALVVNLYIDNNQPGDDSVTIIPNDFQFSMVAGNRDSLGSCFLITSSNGPAPYSVTVQGTNFTDFVSPTGMTGDSACFNIWAPALIPGIYVDTAVFQVGDIAGTHIATITLEVTGTPPPVDSPFVSPDTLFLTASTGSTTPLNGCASAFFGGDPIGFTASMFDTRPPITTLDPDSIGFTNDTVCFSVDPTGLEIGFYTNSILFDFEGYDANQLVVIALTVIADSTSAFKPELAQNYPNPFNPTTQIKFTLGTPSRTTLTVYNLLGQQVVKLVDGQLGAGNHTITWDASDKPSGVYFYRLETEAYTETRKMILLK